MVLIPLLISTLSYSDSWNSAIPVNVPHCYGCERGWERTGRALGRRVAVIGAQGERGAVGTERGGREAERPRLKISSNLVQKAQDFQKWEFLILKTVLSCQNPPSSGLSGLSVSRPLRRPLRSDRSPLELQHVTLSSGRYTARPNLSAHTHSHAGSD